MVPFMSFPDLEDEMPANSHYWEFAAVPLLRGAMNNLKIVHCFRGLEDEASAISYYWFY